MNPLEAEKNPSGLNKPSSGTYGEKAAADRLKASLPAAEPAQPASPLPPVSPQPVRLPTPGVDGRPPTGGQLPPGVPAVVARPTSRPDVPLTTPLFTPQAPSPAVATPSQSRLALLDTLANSPDVSDETREWARAVLNLVIRAPKR